MMFGRVAKTPIADTVSELVEMDFVDYGDYAAFLHTRDTFSRFPVVVFIAPKKKDGRTAEMARVAAISHWLAAFGAPKIIGVCKDM